MADVKAYGFNIEAPTSALTLTVNTATGGLTLGTYYYAYTYVTAFGETTISPSASLLTTNSSIVVSGLPEFVNNVASFNIYRGTVGSTTLRLLKNVLISNTSTVDSASDASLGTASPPGENTANSNAHFDGTYTHTKQVTFMEDVIVSGNIVNAPLTTFSPFNSPAGTLENTSATTSSPINAANAGALTLTQTPMTSSPTSLTQSYGRPVTDGTNVYLSTQSLTGSNPGPDDTSYIICMNAATRDIVWKRIVSSYSGIPSDQSRGGPTLYGNYLYFTTTTDLPQTFSPYTNVVRRFVSPAVSVSGTGRPPRVYCVDKRTGDLVWEREVGATATAITDLDNWMILSAAPTVVEVDMFGDGKKIPIVVCGTSSNQSFRPWLYCPNNLPFGPNIGSLPEYQHTDVGRVIIINGHTGEILKTHRMAKTYVAGDTVDAAMLIAPATTVDINRFIAPADVAAAGILNSANPDFTTNLMWVLDAAVNAPPMLQGKTFTDNTGIASVIPVAAVAGANFNKVVIEIPVTFKPASAQVDYLAVLYAVNAQMLDGTTGLRRARIIWTLNSGATLSADEAYQCSWWGASTWCQTVAVKSDGSGDAVEIYMATGQNHAIPYFESTLFDGADNHIPQIQSIKAAQDAYVATPNPTTFAAIATAYNDIETANIARLAIPKSASGQLNKADAVVCIRLNDSGVFAEKWVFKATAYDVWHTGYTIDALRRSADGVTAFAGYDDIQKFFGAQVGGDEDFGAGPIYDAVNDRVFACNKGGSVWTLDVSGGSAVVLDKTRISNGGIVGGANYGISFDGVSVYCNNSNAIDNNAINATPALGGTLPDNFPPLVDWYLPDTTNLPSHNSYITKYNTGTFAIDWAVLLTPELAGVVTVGPISVVNNLVAMLDGLGKLKFFNTVTGALAGSYTLEAGGQTTIMTLNGKLYIFPARGLLSQTFPTSVGYTYGKYLYQLSA